MPASQVSGKVFPCQIQYFYKFELNAYFWCPSKVLMGVVAKRRSHSWMTGFASSSEAKHSWVATSGCQATTFHRTWINISITTTIFRLRWNSLQQSLEERAGAWSGTREWLFILIARGILIWMWMWLSVDECRLLTIKGSLFLKKNH